MEQERKIGVPKLVEVAARDFSGASGVGVSFPDQWEHVETIKTESSPVYVAGFPIERAFHGREHFEGLPPEINVNLVFYRLYKFFQPWPMPRVTVEWNTRQAQGRVTEVEGFQLRLQPIGQAQAWFGVDNAVLWECYLEESRRSGNGQDILADVWRTVERDVGAPKLFTMPHEPAFMGNYKDYLRKLGYAADPKTDGWWSKTIPRERNQLTRP